MHFAGTLPIRVPRANAWAFLTDAQTVGQCVPDLEQLDVIDDANFRAVVRAGIGPVRGRFSFDVTWQELVEPGHARMTARGKAPGSAVTVDSSMDLAETPDGTTELAWSADVVVHGTIASVGARLLNGFAEKQTQRFFDCLRVRLEAEPPPPPAGA
jgi:carbon monoxide dehydrogenase subunit G